MDYLGNLISSIFSMVFIVFLIGTVGYFLGAISVKGISLGTAGVLVAALLYGIITSYVPSFTVGTKEIVLFDDSVKKTFNLVSSLGTAMFVTSVGFIAGPKFFRSFNRSKWCFLVLWHYSIFNSMLLFYIYSHNILMRNLHALRCNLFGVYN